MGTLNLKEYVKNIEKFKENKCPVCDNEIGIDNNYKINVDCIHYTCLDCSPSGCVISMSGSLLASDNFNKILKDAMVKNYVRDKIRKCTSGEISIMMSDFRS